MMKSVMGDLVGKVEMEAPEGAAVLRIPAEPELPQVEPMEMSDLFLASVSEDLKATADVDADLTRIISDHLLTATPEADAVANAEAAIVAIAAKRAAPAK